MCSGGQARLTLHWPTEALSCVLRQTAHPRRVGWRFTPGFALACVDGYEVPPASSGCCSLSEVRCRFLLIQVATQGSPVNAERS